MICREDWKPMKLTIAICDDNEIILDNETKVITSVLAKKGIEHTAKKFNDPQSLLSSQYTYDIVFLDIEMDNLNGIEAAKELRQRNDSCLIFFVTNYEEYLDEALNQHAFRFWKKPLDKNKLLYGIESAIRELKESKQLITIHIRNKKTQILSKNIIYIYVSRKLVHIVSVNGEIIAEDTYRDIYEQLVGSNDFCESNRGYCVNFRYVKYYTTNTLFCGYRDEIYKLNISRRKYENFHLSFVNWIGGKR